MLFEYFFEKIGKYKTHFSFQDERFNHDIDVLTGYKTRTLLCMPIKDTNGDVIGVAQVNYENKSKFLKKYIVLKMF